MKRLIVLLGLFILVGCGVEPRKNSVITIVRMEFSKDPEKYGKYVYGLYITNSPENELSILTDSLYKLGDTLIFTKKR